MSNILVTFRDIECLGKINYLDICHFIRDIKGYGILGTPLYKPQLYQTSYVSKLSVDLSHGLVNKSQIRYLKLTDATKSGQCKTM